MDIGHIKNAIEEYLTRLGVVRMSDYVTSINFGEVIKNEDEGEIVKVELHLGKEVQ